VFAMFEAGKVDSYELLQFLQISLSDLMRLILPMNQLADFDRFLHVFLIFLFFLLSRDFLFRSFQHFPVISRKQSEVIRQFINIIVVELNWIGRVY
jgi:hypothetical protein